MAGIKLSIPKISEISILTKLRMILKNKTKFARNKKHGNKMTLLSITIMLLKYQKHWQAFMNGHSIS